MAYVSADLFQGSGTGAEFLNYSRSYLYSFFKVVKAMGIIKVFLRFALVAIFTIACAISFPCRDSVASCCLQIRNEEGKLLLSAPARENDMFAIRFIHSVALSPVTDFYRIKDCRIFLEKTVYHDFGAGLPHMAEAGQTMKTEGGEIILDGFNRELPEFDVRVGRVAQHALLLYESGKDVEKAREIPFDSLAKPGSALHFGTSRDCGN